LTRAGKGCHRLLEVLHLRRHHERDMVLHVALHRGLGIVGQNAFIQNALVPLDVF